MATELYSDNDVSVSQFWGGTERGMCIQITDRDSFVQLTEDMLNKILPVLNRWLKERIEKDDKD